MAAQVRVASRNHFSVAEIIWKINNISLGLCDDKEAVVSPDFVVSGRINTIWRMLLTFSDVKNMLVIKLKLLDHEFKECENEDLKTESVTPLCRCTFVESEGFKSERKDSKATDEDSTVMKEDPEGDESDELKSYRQKSTFKVNWIAHFFEKPLIGEETFHFEKNIELPVSTFDCSKVLQDLSRTEADYLELKCFMLVDFEHESPIPCHGLPSSIWKLSKSLSKGLRSACRSFWDIKINALNGRFYLNKDMLFHRGEGFRKMILRNPEKIDLLNYDGDSLYSIFRYLYSGRLEYILKPLSLTVCDYIERLGITELKHTYPKEKITMESNVEGREFVFDWKIDDFEAIDDNLDGPELYAEGMGSRWQLHLQLKRPERSDEFPAVPDNENFVYLAATLVKTQETLNVSLEFSYIDEEGKIICTRRVQGKMKVGDRKEVECFPRGDVMRSLSGKALLVRFTVRFRAGSVSTAIKEIVSPSFDLAIDHKEALYHFCDRMLYMLNHPKYPDAILYCHCDTNRRGIHRFILAVNSQKLHKQMDYSEIPCEDKFELVLVTNEIRFIDIFLKFLYTGIIDDPELEICAQMLQLGDFYGVDSLIPICEEKISRDLRSLFYVLDYAQDNALISVKRRVLCTLSIRGDEVLEHSDWEEFESSKPELAERVRAEINMLKEARRRRLVRTNYRS